MKQEASAEAGSSYTSCGKLQRAVATTTTERPAAAPQEAEAAPLPKQESIGALMKRFSGRDRFPIAHAASCLQVLSGLPCEAVVSALAF